MSNASPTILKKLITVFLAVIALAEAVSGQTTQPVSVDALIQQQIAAAAAKVQAADAQATQAAIAAAVAPLNQQIAALTAKLNPATKGFLGTNDNGNYYWQSNGRFGDAAKAFSGFYADDESPKTGVTYGPDGYPTCAAMAQSYLDDYPAGQYLVTWDGNAKFDFSGTPFVVNADNQSGTLTLAQPGQLTWLKVHSSDPKNSLHNLHIWSPGYGPGTPNAGQVYRKEFLDVLRHFNCVRVMGNQRINDTTEAHWSDRTQPTAWDQTSGGTAIELLVEEANEAGVDLWLCVPAMADDDYVTRMAQLAHACKHRVHVEYANEVWNWGMPVPWKFNNAQANDPAQAAQYDGQYDSSGKIVPYLDANGLPTLKSDGNTRDARRIAERTRTIGILFRQAFADRPASDLRVVLGGQCGWNFWIDEGLHWLTAKYGSTGVDEAAIAPYFDSWWNSGQYIRDPNNVTVDDEFTAINKFLDNDLPGQIDANLNSCQKYGVKLIAYEGGQSLGAPNVDFTTPGFLNNPATLAQSDPRMGLAYAKLFAIAHAHGVTQFEQLGLLGRWDKNGYWSVLRNLNDQTPANVRWQALMAEAAKSN